MSNPNSTCIDNNCEKYCYDYSSHIEYSCSSQCRKSRSYTYGSHCPSSYSVFSFSSSSCSHDDDSKNITHSKSNNAENLILYWGKTENKIYYIVANMTDYKKISYLNNVITQKINMSICVEF